MNDYFKIFFENVKESFRESWLSLVSAIPNILLAILIITIGFLLAGKVAKLSRGAVSRRTNDVITINFLSKAVKLIFVAIVIMYALKVAGLQSIAAGFFAAAGASAVIIGFAFRDIGENFISGIILSFNRPFNVNDTVSIGDIFGKVKNIEFRYTKLKTFDGRDVYIPNSDVITKPVYNFTEDGYFRFDFLVGIGYEDNIENAEKLIMEVLGRSPGVYQDDAHEYFVFVEQLAASTVNLKVHFWIKTFEYGREALLIKGKIISEVKSALIKEGFNLPADIREIKLYNSQSTIPISILPES